MCFVTLHDKFPASFTLQFFTCLCMFMTELKLKHSGWWWCSDAGLKRLCWCCYWVVAKALGALLKPFGGSLCICTCILECVRMRLCVRALQSGAEMNRSCGSHTVLTGSPGTIALTDPSDWVHMRIKTLSLPLSEFFLLPSPRTSAPHCVAHSHFPSHSLLFLVLLFMSLLCLRSPFLLPPFLLPSYFYLYLPQLWLALLCFDCGEVLGLYCWSDHGPKTSARLHGSESICHRGVHCSTCAPLPSGAELETLKCVPFILLFLKA